MNHSSSKVGFFACLFVYEADLEGETQWGKFCS